MAFIKLIRYICTNPTCIDIHSSGIYFVVVQAHGEIPMEKNVWNSSLFWAAMLSKLPMEYKQSIKYSSAVFKCCCPFCVQSSRVADGKAAE